LFTLCAHLCGPRFECFLMKSLRHPNIVKLVGVCWDDGMFACCLEFVENGSLEDWLRRTTGGTAYDPSKKKTKKKKTGEKETARGASILLRDTMMPLSEVVFRGYDLTTHSEAMHTSADNEQVKNFMATMESFAAECATPETAAQNKWIPALDASGLPLDADVQGYGKYSSTSRFGESFARAEIAATPAQVFALYQDPRAKTSETLSTTEHIERTAGSDLDYLHVPVNVPGVSDRETLARGVWKVLDDGR